MQGTTSSRSPFDDAGADIIFRSSDKVEFRLYKVIIAKASPVFRGMLDLPQPPSSTSSLGEPPVVDLAEDAKTLENLLRFCYPVEHPVITSVGGVHAILEAAQKYEMASITANMGGVLKQILPNEPWRVYAVAYMLKLGDIAKEAALLLDIPDLHLPLPPVPEFRFLPTAAIYAAHEYRRNCLDAALKAWGDRTWIAMGIPERAVRVTANLIPTPLDKSNAWSWIACGFCTSGNGRPAWVTIGTSSVRCGKWFEMYHTSLKLALEKCPSGRTVRTHLFYNQDSAALTTAASCSHCGPKAYADLKRFCELLAEKIDSATSQIEIKLD